MPPVTAASVVNVTVLRLPAPASGNKTPPLPNDASALPATETAKIVLPSAALGLPRSNVAVSDTSPLDHTVPPSTTARAEPVTSLIV